jgi:MFS family permease
VHLRTVAMVPLEPGDPNGMGLMLFLSLAGVLGGLPAGVAMGILTKPRRPRSLADAGTRLLLTGVYSAVIALALALLADWILGYGGTQMLSIWGWATLLVGACMVCVEAFIAAFGIPGILLAAIPLLFFGIPGAPWPAPWNWQSSLFRVLGPYDPVGAFSDGVRNTIFFTSADPTKDLLVLLAWIVVPVLLMVGLGWDGQRRGEAHQGGLVPSPSRIAAT